MKFDHHPLLLDTQEEDLSRARSRPFQYLAAWQQHLDFKKFFSDNWQSDAPLVNGLLTVAVAISHWNRKVFGNIHSWKSSLMLRIAGIHGAANPFLCRLEHSLSSELEEMLR